MFNRIKKFLGAKSGPPSAHDENAAQVWYDHKSNLLESILGKEHNVVMHAIIPYAVGGALDLYYYPHGIAGTGIATKELSELPNQGSANRDFSCYELAMFTRHPLNLDEAKDKASTFGTAHSKMNAILNRIARYSETAKLNPGDTCEFPAEIETVGGKCLIFDGYGSRSDAVVRKFGVLVILEIFRSEMNFARAQSGSKLLETIKNSGHYPYSDLEREPVA